jgi:hypothetical protein
MELHATQHSADHLPSSTEYEEIEAIKSKTTMAVYYKLIYRKTIHATLK